MTAGKNPDDAPSLLEHKARTRRRLVIAERVWFGVLAAVAATVILGAGIVLASAHPRSCGTCHSTAVSTAESNAHSFTRCESCHAGDSAAGILQGRLAVIDMAVATVLPSRVRVVSNTPSQLCLDCHQEEMASTITVGDLRMSHRAPLEAGWECSTCHPSAGHDVGSAMRGYTMDMCFTCHSANAENLETCRACHVDEAQADTSRQRRRDLSPWRITHGPNWRITHGMGDMSICSSCHRKGYCTRCHGENVPHPEAYLRDHGRDVQGRSDGKKQCLTCHRDDACDDCHGLSMPHPDGFLNGHAKVIRTRDEEYAKLCTRCHKKESCEACHARHIHPGLSPEYIEALKRRPVR